jgi:hypothetical protein
LPSPQGAANDVHRHHRYCSLSGYSLHCAHKKRRGTSTIRVDIFQHQSRNATAPEEASNRKELVNMSTPPSASNLDAYQAAVEAKAAQESSLAEILALGPLYARYGPFEATSRLPSTIPLHCVECGKEQTFERTDGDANDNPPACVASDMWPSSRNPSTLYTRPTPCAYGKRGSQAVLTIS